MSGIALIGNPGTGKSTILNGLVGSSKFSSGMSFGGGRTKYLQQHIYNGTLYFDTPGLNDIEMRKEAGREIDTLLQENISLKIIFVVFALNGRIMPEDATTIRLVLDAIKSVDTNDRFGVIVNQAPKEWIEKLKSSPIRENSVRLCYTGNRHTSYWCYVPFCPELSCVENGQLMNNELKTFFDNVPVTRPEHALVEKIDTDSFEEKLECERKLFEEREKILKIKLEEQKNRMEALENLAEELRTTISKERTENACSKQKLKEKQRDLENQIRDQVKKVQDASRHSKDMQMDLEHMKVMAEMNERKSKIELEEIQRKFELEFRDRERDIMSLEKQIKSNEQRDMLVAAIEVASEVGPLLAAAFALL